MEHSTRDDIRDDVELAAEVGACVQTLVPLLEAPHRTILTLTELEGLDVAAAAKRLGLTVAHARVQLHRARTVLRALLALSCASCPHPGCADCACDGCAAGGRDACH